MSIFRRENEAPAPASPVTPVAPARKAAPEKRGAATTTIAVGSKVVGQLSGSAELVIDGEIEGEIDLESLVVVGSEGLVKGQIQARAIQVGGRVRGNVRGFERVEVLASGSLEGDVVAPRVVIAEGAFFKGKVEMTDKVGPGGGSSAASSKGGGPGGPPAKGGSGAQAGEAKPAERTSK